jgi:hypothetical protein
MTLWLGAVMCPAFACGLSVPLALMRSADPVPIRLARSLRMTTQGFPGARRQPFRHQIIGALNIGELSRFGS